MKTHAHYKNIRIGKPVGTTHDVLYRVENYIQETKKEINQLRPIDVMSRIDDVLLYLRDYKGFTTFDFVLKKIIVLIRNIDANKVSLFDTLTYLGVNYDADKIELLDKSVSSHVLQYLDAIERNISSIRKVLDDWYVDWANAREKTTAQLGAMVANIASNITDNISMFSDDGKNINITKYTTIQAVLSFLSFQSSRLKDWMDNNHQNVTKKTIALAGDIQYAIIQTSIKIKSVTREEELQSLVSYGLVQKYPQMADSVVDYLQQLSDTITSLVDKFSEF